MAYDGKLGGISTSCLLPLPSPYSVTFKNSCTQLRTCNQSLQHYRDKAPMFSLKHSKDNNVKYCTNNFSLRGYFRYLVSRIIYVLVQANTVQNKNKYIYKKSNYQIMMSQKKINGKFNIPQSIWEPYYHIIYSHQVSNIFMILSKL